MYYKVEFTTNKGTDDFTDYWADYDLLIKDIGELLEEVYDEFERKYPSCEIRWVNRFWGDVLKKETLVKTEIYVAGQDDYCECVVREDM